MNLMSKSSFQLEQCVVLNLCVCGFECVCVCVCVCVCGFECMVGCFLFCFLFLFFTKTIKCYHMEAKYF